MHLSAPLEAPRARDVEGFYAAAEAGELDTVPGINFAFEEPQNPDLILPTHEISIAESVERLVKLLQAEGAFAV